MSLPDEKKVEECLHYLANTDETYGQLTANVKALEHALKAERSLAFLEASGTVAEREAKALVSEGYMSAVEHYENAIAERETVYARRKRAELTIEVWRSVNANRRQG